jgi:hypothetical protein|tara:strand:- start:1279 stop:1452 length:174 start_codon:yes stop_codon:yes gene_type:complete
MLKGKKTYFTAGAAVMTALGLYFGGEADLTVTINSIFGALMVIFLRKGVASSEKMNS